MYYDHDYAKDSYINIPACNVKNIFPIVILCNDACSQFEQLARRFHVPLFGGIVKRCISILIFLIQNRKKVFLHDT